MADTTLKISEEARDRLCLLAEERGISTCALVERVAASIPTAQERAQRTAAGVAYVRRRHLGVVLDEDDLREAEARRTAISDGQVGRRL